MALGTTSGIHLVDAPAAAPESGAGVPRRAPWAPGVLAGLVLLAALLAYTGREERALRSLPADERAALYRRTLENLRTVCAGERSHEIREFCRGQAQLVLLFPECDGVCQAIARERLRTPTR